MPQGAQTRKSIHKSSSIVTFCQGTSQDIYLKSVGRAKRAENTATHIFTWKHWHWASSPNTSSINDKWQSKTVKIFNLKVEWQSQRAGSVVQSNCCPWRGLQFGHRKHMTAHSYQSPTYMGHMYNAHTDMQSHTHRIKNKQTKDRTKTSKSFQSHGQIK